MRLLYHVVKAFDQKGSHLFLCSLRDKLLQGSLVLRPVLGFLSLHSTHFAVLQAANKLGKGLGMRLHGRDNLVLLSAFTMLYNYCSTITMPTAHMLPFQHPTLHTHWPHFTQTLLDVTYMHLENPMFFYVSTCVHYVVGSIGGIGLQGLYYRWAKPWECPYTQHMIGSWCCELAYDIHSHSRAVCNHFIS